MKQDLARGLSVAAYGTHGSHVCHAWQQP